MILTLCENIKFQKSIQLYLPSSRIYNLSVYLSIHLSIYQPSIYQSVNATIYLFISLSVSLTSVSLNNQCNSSANKGTWGKICKGGDVRGGDGCGGLDWGI